ncbi:MAG: hypothetical protein ACFFDN_04845 [Candidatus Hodarchaeota archaeon]
MIKTKDDKCILSSGKYFYDNLISIDTDGKFYEGYDNDLWGGYINNSYEPFTTDEKKEIADFMIDRWIEFKKRLED